LVEDGQVLQPHTLLIDNLQKEHNLSGKPHTARSPWAEGLSVKNLSQDKAEVAFFAGCRFNYDADLSKTARATVTLLKNAGLDIGILGEEFCCGGRAYQMGYRKEFAQCAATNIAALNKAGVKTIITSCADCYQAFKRLYPQAGSRLEVFHTVEILDRWLKEGRLQFNRPVPLTVTYHDPCHLGRQGEPYIPWNGKETKIHGQIVVYEPPKPRYNGAWGIYDPPRNILKSIPGIKLVEMERIREYAWCCGAGGGVREAYPQFSLWTANERIIEANSTGAEAIVSACPWCEKNFQEAIDSQESKMKVLDVMDLVQQAI